MAIEGERRWLDNETLSVRVEADANHDGHLKLNQQPATRPLLLVSFEGALAFGGATKTNAPASVSRHIARAL
jgi:hypothetical protein